MTKNSEWASTTVSYPVVSTITVNRRKDGSISFFKAVIDRDGREQTVSASNKVGEPAIMSHGEKMVFLPADFFLHSDASSARYAASDAAKKAVREWDGLDARVLEAAIIAARDHYCTQDEIETLAYEPCARGRGWQGEVPAWDGIFAADINGLALLWSGSDSVSVRQIPVNEDVQKVVATPKYRMRIGEITAHYRDVCSLLTRHEIDAEARAKIAGVAEQTLKSYGAMDGTTAHRKIPVGTLNLLREAAVDAYWEAAEAPYRTQVKYEVGNPSHIVPTLIALRADGSMCERHVHPLRVLERADIHGGHVIDTTGAPVSVALDEAAELRHRWRKAAYKCDWPVTDGGMTSEEFLCDIAACCPYSLWRIGSEFSLWSIQPTLAMVERLERAVSELEREAA